MGAAGVIFWMLMICGAFVLFLLFPKPVGGALRILVNAGVGCAAMWGINFFLGPMGLSVGINLLTGFIAGVLGAPGLVLLYAAQAILK